MGSWNDFNDAKQTTNLIPKGTLAKVHMSIRPGGFDDPVQGWTGGYFRPREVDLQVTGTGDLLLVR